MIQTQIPQMSVFHNKINHTKYKKPALASEMSNYVPNVMGLFYFTLMQNERFHCRTEANILQGHGKVVWDMQDVMDNWRVGSSPL